MKYKKEVAEFVKNYQELIDMIEISYLGGKAFKIRINETEDKSGISVMESMLINTNISSAPNFIRHIYFTDDVLMVNEFILFAGNSTYGFHYAIDKRNNQIILLDENFDFVFDVAKNELSFLKVLSLLAKCELLVLNEDSSAGKKKIYETYQSICIQAAGGDDYSAYYKQILYCD